MKTDLERFKELFDSVGLNYCNGRKCLGGSTVAYTIDIEDSNEEFSEFTFTPEGKFKEFNGLQ